MGLNMGLDLALILGTFATPVWPAIVLGVVSYALANLSRKGSGYEWEARFSPYPLCMMCGYNLTGNQSGVCPECGTTIPHALAI
jgi:hypothetical protein